jgi:hypothetical protein
MHYSGIDRFVWAVSFFETLALALVLIGRGRWRQFPIFTCWLIFITVRSIALFAFYQHDSRYWYTMVYMICLALDFAFQMGVVFEIARIVLRPTGTWVRDARRFFASTGLLGILVAVLFAWWITPSATSAHRVWETRTNLFTSLVICELFVVMSLAANRVGLAWRSHVMAIGQGLTLWSSTMVIKDMLQSFPGTQLIYMSLDRIRVTYMIAIGWIIIELWREEPERKPISSDLQEYILALHKRVEYDLLRIAARH